MNTSADLRNSSTDPELEDGGSPFRGALITVLVATVLVSAAVAAYVYFGQKPPVASGQVLSVRPYPVPTTTTSANGAEGMQGTGETFDQALLFTQIRVHNETNIPLFLQEIAATITLPDGSELTSLATGEQDYSRVFQAYPGLASWRGEPLRRDITLTPGQTVEGQAIFNYPINKQQWDGRRALNVRLSFIHQKDLVIPAAK